MKPQKESRTYQEMLEGIRIFSSFRAASANPLIYTHLKWKELGAVNPGIHVVGEGSSLHVPYGNLKYLAERDGVASGWPISGFGGLAACELEHEHETVILVSNSGTTGEIVNLAEILKIHMQHPAVCAVTANGDSNLARICGSESTAVLACGKEEVVPATKSVIEQGLIMQAMLFPEHFEDPHFRFANSAYAVKEILTETPIETEIVEGLAQADHIYVAGRENGAAREAALKFTEIFKTRTTFFPDTNIIHGPQEGMQAGDVVVLLDPFPVEGLRKKIADVLVNRVGAKVFAVSDEQTNFPTMVIPDVHRVFKAYSYLVAAWALSIAAAERKGVNPDEPKYATKVATTKAELALS